MPQPTENAVNVFLEGSHLSLAPSNPLLAPVFQAISRHPWRIDVGELVIDLGTHSETLTATQVVLAARGGMFSLSVEWADPKFLKTKAPAVPVAAPKVKGGKKTKAKESATVLGGEEEPTT